MLKVDQLTKHYGRQTAVNGLSFSLRKGEVAALLGPNGAGKSTTMKMIAGFLEPDHGTVLLNDWSVLSDRLSAQSQLGYLPEGAPLYDEMTARSYLTFLSRMKGSDPEDWESRFETVVTDTRIGDVLHKPISALSKGYRRRVALAGAIFMDPPILMLDEPTDGLDPNQKKSVRDLIARLSPEKAILISTHSLDEIEPMCNRVIFMDRGKLIFDGTPTSLGARDDGGDLERVFRTMTTSAEAI